MIGRLVKIVFAENPKKRKITETLILLLPLQKKSTKIFEKCQNLLNFLISQTDQKFEKLKFLLCVVLPRGLKETALYDFRPIDAYQKQPLFDPRGKVNEKILQNHFSSIFRCQNLEM